MVSEIKLQVCSVLCTMNKLLVYAILVYITSEFVKRRKQTKPHLQLTLQFTRLVFTLALRHARLVPFYRLESKVDPPEDRPSRVLSK